MAHDETLRILTRNQKARKLSCPNSPDDSLLAMVARIGGEGSPGDPYLFCVNLPSFDTVNACRPFRRRAASTRRPPLVDMRARKPKRRNRGMRFGWYVRLVDTLLLLDPANRIHMVRRIKPGAGIRSHPQSQPRVGMCAMTRSGLRGDPHAKSAASLKETTPQRATEHMRHGSIVSHVPRRQMRVSRKTPFPARDFGR